MDRRLFVVTSMPGDRFRLDGVSPLTEDWFVLKQLHPAFRLGMSAAAASGLLVLVTRSDDGGVFVIPTMIRLEAA